MLFHLTAIEHKMNMALQKFAHGATHYCKFKHTALCENALHYDNKTTINKQILCRFQKIFFQRSKKWNTPFYLQMFCAFSGRSLSRNTPVFSRFTSRVRTRKLHRLPFFSHSYASQLIKYCGKRSFLGVAKSWKATLIRVPWFGRHVENLGDVIIYPVLVVARTGSRLLSSASGHGTVAKRTVGKGRDFFLLPIFPRAILPRIFSFVTCRLTGTAQREGLGGL